MSLVLYLDQVKLQLYNNDQNQVFTITNEQNTTDITQLGLVLAGYDFPNMINI